MKAAEECLEEALRAWEDMRLLEETHARVSIGRRLLEQDALARYTKWRTYRRTLLDNGIRSLNLLDWTPGLSDAIPAATRESTHDLYPLEFFEWTRKSRKVFAIPEAEQRLFEIATMPDFRWQDITWPYGSYIIELAAPIRLGGRRGAVACSHVLVSQFAGAEREDEVHAIVLRFFFQNGYTSVLSSRERKDILHGIEKGDAERVAQAFARSHARTGLYYVSQGDYTMCLYNSYRDRQHERVQLDDESIQWRIQNPELHPLNKTLAAHTPDARFAIARLLRIVVGLNIYLDTLDTSAKPAWEKKKGGRKYIGPLGIITKETDVCRIIGRGVIDPARYSESARNHGKGFTRPHWRRKHRKRPPYTPKDHPKTILIPATLINEHLVPYFGIIAGSVTRILSDE